MPSPEKTTRSQFWTRLAIGHFVADAIAAIYLVGSIPLVIVGLGEARLLAETEKVLSRLILIRVGWIALAMLTIGHLLVLPWALGSSKARKRAFIATSIVLAVIGLIGGGSTWIWLIFKKA